MTMSPTQPERISVVDELVIPEDLPGIPGFVHKIGKVPVSEIILPNTKQLKEKAIQEHEHRIVMEKDFDKFLQERQSFFPMPILLALQGLL
jgi:hypothetical protein